MHRNYGKGLFLKISHTWLCFLSGFSVPDFKNKTGIGVICCFTGTKRLLKQ